MKEKQLLLIDLCARLPYNVKVKYIFDDRSSCPFILSTKILNETIEKGFKPYLRPMSSMTEEEKIELCTISYAPDEMKTIDEKLYVIQTNAENAADFYNKHHFDYRGLIEKSLAIIAPEGMYKTE